MTDTPAPVLVTENYARDLRAAGGTNQQPVDWMIASPPGDLINILRRGGYKAPKENWTPSEQRAWAKLQGVNYIPDGVIVRTLKGVVRIQKAWRLHVNNRIVTRITDTMKKNNGHSSNDIRKHAKKKGVTSKSIKRRSGGPTVEVKRRTNNRRVLTPTPCRINYSFDDKSDYHRIQTPSPPSVAESYVNSASSASSGGEGERYEEVHDRRMPKKKGTFPENLATRPRYYKEAISVQRRHKHYARKERARRRPQSAPHSRGKIDHLRDSERVSTKNHPLGFTPPKVAIRSASRLDLLSKAVNLYTSPTACLKSPLFVASKEQGLNRKLQNEESVSSCDTIDNVEGATDVRTPTERCRLAPLTIPLKSLPPYTNGWRRNVHHQTVANSPDQATANSPICVPQSPVVCQERHITHDRKTTDISVPHEEVHTVGDHSIAGCDAPLSWTQRYFREQQQQEEQEQQWQQSVKSQERRSYNRRPLSASHASRRCRNNFHESPTSIYVTAQRYTSPIHQNLSRASNINHIRSGRAEEREVRGEMDRLLEVQFTETANIHRRKK